MTLDDMLDDSALLRILDLLYATASRPEAWREVLDALVTAMGASAGMLQLRQERPSRLLYLVLAGDLDPDWTRLYESGRFRDGPFAQVAAQLPAGAAQLTAERLPRAALERTEFFQELMRPRGLQDGIAGVVAREPSGTLAGLGLGRAVDAPGWGEPEIAFVRRLMPHLRRAVDVTLALSAARDGAAIAEAALDRIGTGVVIFAEDGRVLRANRAAEVLLRAGEGLRLERGTDAAAGIASLHAATPEATARLRALLAGALDAKARPEARGGRLALPRPPLLHPLGGTVVRLERQRSPLGLPRAAAALFLADPSGRMRSREGALREVFGLTAAEARIAALIADGLAPKQAALETGVALNTVRTHLKQIYARTGASGQAALVRLVLTGVPDVATGP